MTVNRESLNKYRKYHSRLSEKLEAWFAAQGKNLTFAQIIDNNFKDGHSLDTIANTLQLMTGLKILRSTLGNAIRAEINLAQRKQSTLKYRNQAKTAGNPLRKKHRWKKNELGFKRNTVTAKPSETPLTTKNKHKVVFHCQACNESYMTVLQYTDHNHIGLRAYACEKCNAVGQGFMQLTIQGARRYTKLTPSKTIAGLMEERIVKNPPKTPTKQAAIGLATA